MTIGSKATLHRGAVVVALLLVVTVLQTALAAGTADADARTYFGENGYLLVETLYDKWDDANADATSMPTRGCEEVHLATVTSPQEQAIVAGLMEGSDHNAWMGGLQPPGELSLEDGWTWVTGETWAYTNWAFGEPNDNPYGDITPGSEQYLEIYQHGAWNDAPGWDLAGPKYFVVEYEDCPAAIRRPQPVTITVDEEIPTEIPGGGGPFVASGPAVDYGVMCETGTTLNTAAESQPAATFTRLEIEKQFTCDDGSGDFIVRLRAKLYPDGTTTATWQIVSGTGWYDTLTGSGGLVGTPTDPGFIEDVYSGKLKG